MRKVKDAVDLTTNEKIFFRSHAKATYMSDGRQLNDLILAMLARIEALEKAIGGDIPEPEEPEEPDMTSNILGVAMVGYAVLS